MAAAHGGVCREYSAAHGGAGREYSTATVPRGHGPAKADLGAQELSAVQPDPEPVGYSSCTCVLFSFNGAQRQELKRERENDTINVFYVVLMLRRTESVRTVRLKAVL